LLEDTRGALASGRDAEALRHACEAWRRVRAPALAELVDGIDERVRPARPPIGGKSQKEQQAAWLARAKAGDAGDAALLAGGVITTSSKVSEARLVALADTDDPRLAARLLEWMRDPPFTALSTRSFWKLVFATAARLRDVRLLAAEAELRRRWEACFAYEPQRDYIGRRLTEALDEIRKHGEPVLSANAAQLASAIRGQLGGPSMGQQTQRTEAELISDVWAHPADDAPRLVYGDWLSERDNPRGEFIALQFKRQHAALSPTEDKREKSLLAAHGKAWLGPLKDVLQLKGLRFARGFVAAGEIPQVALNRALKLIGHPVWSTLEELRGGVRVDLLVKTDFPSLRKLTRPLYAGDLLMLAERKELLAIEYAEIVVSSYDELPLERQRDIVAELAALPRLVEVSVNVGAIDSVTWLVESPIARRVARLEIRQQPGHPDLLPERNQAFDAVVASLVGEQATAPTLTLERPWSMLSGTLGDVTLLRDAHGKYRPQ
jgi:uncharacterized protein (TIGR02996 family)